MTHQSEVERLSKENFNLKLRLHSIDQSSSSRAHSSSDSEWFAKEMQARDRLLANASEVVSTLKDELLDASSRADAFQARAEDANSRARKAAEETERLRARMQGEIDGRARTESELRESRSELTELKERGRFERVREETAKEDERGYLEKWERFAQSVTGGDGRVVTLSAFIDNLQHRLVVAENMAAAANVTVAATKNTWNVSPYKPSRMMDTESANLLKAWTDFAIDVTGTPTIDALAAHVRSLETARERFERLAKRLEINQQKKPVSLQKVLEAQEQLRAASERLEQLEGSRTKELHEARRRAQDLEGENRALKNELQQLVPRSNRASVPPPPPSRRRLVEEGTSYQPVVVRRSALNNIDQELKSSAAAMKSLNVRAHV